MYYVFKAAIIVFVLSICANAQDGASLESEKFFSKDSLIQHLMIVSDNTSLRYVLYGGSEEGIKTLEINSGEKIIGHIECYGSKACRLTGSIPSADLPNKIITASAISSSGKEQKEKILLNSDGEESKVYLISSIPDYSGAQPMVVTNNDQQIQTSKSANKDSDVKNNNIRDFSISGPKLTVQIKKSGRNDYLIQIVAEDPRGVDFIELLENEEFLDVQICENQTECTFVKSLKNRKPGRNKYFIKSMNSKNAFSFQEELLVFSEQ